MYSLPPGISITHEDCMDLMVRYSDNYFDLAVVDPPYGIREDGHRENNRSKLARSKDYHKALWDQERPSDVYFKELYRVSKNQIIWGGNHLSDLISRPSPAWLVWDKDNSGNFADCELAYTSFDTAVRKFKYRWNGMLQQDMNNKEIRIHPTQKPVALYRWVLLNYAKNGDNILDTHFGSGSIAIAVNSLNTIEQMNLTLTACEIDGRYFDQALQRVSTTTLQKTIFQN